MATIAWIEVPRPTQTTPLGYGLDPYGTSPYGSPVTTVSGMGSITWTEISYE